MQQRIKQRQTVQDIDLLPIMNLFSILIPFLLSVAVFQKMAIIEINMPIRTLDQTTSTLPESNLLNLSISITDQNISIWTETGLQREIPVETWVQFQCNGETLESKGPIKCNDKQLTTQSIENLSFRSLNQEALHYNGRPLLQSNGAFLKDHPKNTSMLFSVLGVSTTISSKSAQKLPLSSFHILQKELQNMKLKYADLEDANKAILLASPNMQSDYIIQAMDAIRESGFESINLAQVGL